MSLVLADRVRETTQTTGTGTITLDGAVQGFQSFSVIGNNNTTYYTINRGSEWEVGLGTYYGGTLSRDTIYASSNGGSKVNFSAGSKDVFVTYPAGKSVNEDANNRVLIPYTTGTTNVGSLNVGDATAHTDSGVIASFTASEPLYLYTSLQNTSTANTSYASYAVNDGLHTAYAELGINNSTYSYSAAGFPNNGFSTPLASFVESYGGPLVLGSWDNQKISMIINGAVSTTDAMTINTNGSVAFNGQVGTAGQLLQSNATSAPTWVTPNAGTVTSVSGTGTVNGITLTGTVTSSGNLTLGGTLDLSSPPAIGGTTASTGRFTTITSTVATGTAPFTVASTTPVTNLSIGGNAGTVTNGVYTTDTGTVTNTMLAGSIANAKLTNSSITFGSTAQALGSTVSGLSGVTIDNGAIGGTTAAAGTFTTLIGGSGSANYEQITGGATGKAVQFQSLGSDAAVSLAIQSKSTGAIDLAAGSSGVNISNGGTVTALTLTNGGTSAYTGHPTPAITAPTTAGGVQAVATSNLYYLSTLATTSIVSGGTGYTVSDVITVSGGTFTAAASFTVSAVSGGVVTAITPLTGGTYSVIPTGTLSVTGGTGSGFTLTINGWAIRSLNITNAGSGYVEQPTVTFSGGGGSGAAAYATVGGTSIVKGLGTTTSFANPAGNVLTLFNPQSGTSTVSAVTIANGGTAQIYPSATGGDLAVSSNGTGNIRFLTAVNSYEQLRVSNTTNAVNYVQVTGGATGNPATVTLSAQGSDSNVNMRLTPKGTGTLLTATSATILDGTAIPAGGTAGAGYKLSSTSNFGIFFGSGAPTLSAAKGSIYMRSDGSSIATRMYINTDGSTTWTNVVTAA